MKRFIELSINSDFNDVLLKLGREFFLALSNLVRSRVLLMISFGPCCCVVFKAGGDFQDLKASITFYLLKIGLGAANLMESVFLTNVREGDNLCHSVSESVEA